MRELLEDSDNKDVSKFVGIALGVAGGVIILTGIIWFLYQRYGDLVGNLAGIVSRPVMKTLLPAASADALI